MAYVVLEMFPFERSYKERNGDDNDRKQVNTYMLLNIEAHKTHALKKTSPFI